MILNGVLADAVKLKINAVANGVLVTDACADAINDMTATGRIDDPIVVTPNREVIAKCANGAAAANNGNIIPPGNCPAHAIAIDIILIIDICNAAIALGYGTFGLTIAPVVNCFIKPCLVVINGVCCPSIILWSEPSPQNNVCGYRVATNPTNKPIQPLTKN